MSKNPKYVYCVRKADSFDGVEYTIGVFSTPKNAYELGILPMLNDYGIDSSEVIMDLKNVIKFFKDDESHDHAIVYSGEEYVFDIFREILDVNSYY